MRSSLLRLRSVRNFCVQARLLISDSRGGTSLSMLVIVLGSL